MKNYDLSILIPALREEFISNTVADIVKNKRGNTEVIVGLDGEWAEPGIADHPDVRIVYSPKNLGQRGMTNYICKMSRAKYVAKCDAHCAFDEGFDVKLMEALEGHDNWTIVPVMRNMHVFDWVCTNCEMRYYQGEKPDKCRNEICTFSEDEVNHGTLDFVKDIVWVGKPSPQSTAYRFTPDRLQFKYFGALKKQQEQRDEEIAETMSLQGSFFMLTRDKYWELNISDESWGGWGQQGTEVALKTWLSGGRVVVHRGTWYAHMFRTNDQLSFPWNSGKIKESQGSQQHRARKACVDMFKNNRWDKQVRGLSWLVERFWEPLQQEKGYQPEQNDRPWTKEDLAELKKTEGRFSGEPQPKQLTKGILYFTDNELPLRYATPVRRTIVKIANQKGMELVSSTRKPSTRLGKNVVTNEPRGYLTMFKQILKGLEAMESDIVFMAEHDVLYPPEHFDFTPPDPNKFYYDQNWWKIHEDGLAIHWDADQVSGLCAFRETLINHYKERVEAFNKDNFDRKFEPMSGEKSVAWKASVPHIDIRHDKNLTYNKRGLHHFRNKDTAINLQESTIDNIPGWDKETLQKIYK